MNIEIEDELKNLSPATSEIISEVTDATTTDNDVEDEVEVEDEGFDAEHPYGQSNKVIEADVLTLKAHAACLAAGPLFKNLNSVIEEYKPFILAVKRTFNVKQGYRGLQVQFPDFAEPVFWSEYCEKVFDLTTRRINQLLEQTDASYVKSTPKPLEERTDYIKGLQAGRQQAETQMIAKGGDIKSTLKDIIEEKPQAATPAIDGKDVYAYFDKLEKEPQTVAFEIVAMLEALGFDGQQIKAVSDLMKKQVKAATA
jgi:hypothetical protein